MLFSCILKTCKNSCRKTPHYTHTSAALDFDLPFGHKLFTYDVQVTPEFLTNVMKQFDATQTQENYVVIMGHKPQDCHLVCDLYEARGIKNATPLYWVKPEQYQKGPTKRITQAVEQLMVGYVPNADEVFWCPQHNSQDPRLRENYVEIPSVTTLARDTSGNIINPTEKPPALAQWYFEKWCPRGSWVMVIGAGAGGTVKGAVLAGLNVVAVENDHVQFEALRSELVAWVSKMGEEKKKEKKQTIDEKNDSQTVSPLKKPTSSSSSSGPNSSAPAPVPTECFGCEEKGTDKDPISQCDGCVNFFHVGCLEAEEADADGNVPQPTLCPFCAAKEAP